MQQSYMGVDIGGERGTWICILEPNNDGLSSVKHTSATLEEIVDCAWQYQIAAVAIDAPLTWAISDEKGFRPEDRRLRKDLPKRSRNWVVSQNSLMAVPVRGRQLADYLSPVVGTVIETHPRACLYFAATNSLRNSVGLYKTKNAETHTEELWKFWVRKFRISSDKTASQETPDALDSMVCATIAYLYHHSPEQLRNLSYETREKCEAKDKRGWGPFVVMSPD
jgi:predicted nuclease with RNAse H fold